MRIGYNREKTEQYDARFGAVILAAGLSTRMQAFKPLLPVDGRPALEGLIETVKAAGLSDITVSARILPAAHGRAQGIPAQILRSTKSRDFEKAP